MGLVHCVSFTHNIKMDKTTKIWFPAVQLLLKPCRSHVDAKCLSKNPWPILYDKIMGLKWVTTYLPNSKGSRKKILCLVAQPLRGGRPGH